MPNAGFSWAPKLSEIADAVWTRSERKLTNLDDTRASKIDNLDVTVSSRATNSGVWEYSTRGLTEPVENAGIFASDRVKAEANTERSTANTSYTKLKEFRIFASGTVRVKWEQKSSESAKTTRAKVYRNGVAISEEKTMGTTAYNELTCDIDVESGDYIQIYCRVDDASYTCYIRNAKLCYSISGGETATPIITLD